MNIFDFVANCQKEKAQLNSLTASDLPIDPKVYHLGERPKDPVEAQKFDSRVTELKFALADALHNAGASLATIPGFRNRSDVGLAVARSVAEHDRPARHGHQILLACAYFRATGKGTN
jgi:hypothetical protein